MTDYKKNKISGYHDSFADSRPSDKSTGTLHRLLDNVEDILYSDPSDFYVAMVVSGHSAPPQSSNETRATPASRTEIFDLGDGIPRFGVQIRIISNLGERVGSAGVTKALFDPKEAEALGDISGMEWRVSFHPYAFTKNAKQQAPLYGSMITVRKIDDVFYIDRIINKKAIQFTATRKRGRGNFSNLKYNKTQAPKHLKMRRTKDVPGMFSKLPLINGVDKNIYRGGKIKTYQQMYNLAKSYGVKRIVSLAYDAHYGIKSAKFKCGVRSAVIVNPHDGTTKRKEPGLKHTAANNCEQFWAADLGLEFVGPFYYHGKSLGPEADLSNLEKKFNKGKGKHAEAIWNEVSQVLDQGDVYFHCTHGVDRAGSMAMKYLRERAGFPAGKAYAYSLTVGRGQYRNGDDDNRHLRSFALGEQYRASNNGRALIEKEAKPYFATIKDEIPDAVPLVPLPTK